VNRNYSGFDEFIPDSIVLKKQATSNLGCLILLVILRLFAEETQVHSCLWTELPHP